MDNIHIPNIITQPTTNPFERIDKALGEYYFSCGRADYYDNNGIGKFIAFIMNNNINEKQIDLFLGNEVAPDECLLVYMDDQFPLFNIHIKHANYSRNIEIFNIIQYCYKHGIPPESVECESNTNKYMTEHFQQQKHDEKAEEIIHLDKETTANMQSNDTNTPTVIQNSDINIHEVDNDAFEDGLVDWGHDMTEEIDPMIGSYATEKSKKSKDKSQVEWKCKFGHINKRLEATQNDYKCITCSIPLNINNECIEEEKKDIGNDNDVLIQIENDREIAMLLAEKKENNNDNDAFTQIENDRQIAMLLKKKKENDIDKDVAQIENQMQLMLKKDNYIIFKDLITDKTDRQKIIECIGINNWNDQQL